MGSGLSSSSSHRSSGASSSLHQPPAAAPALVVAVDGSLREFVTPAAVPLLPPVSVSDVLGANADDGRSFVCSSSALYFETDVPALGASELLRPGQLYFVLPAAMLGRPLSGADMAALAVRASQALAAGARPPRGGRRPRGSTRARVVPAAAAHHAHAHGDEEAVNEKLNQRTLGGFETAPPRGPARKPAVAARPAPPVTVTVTERRALSTIEEGAE
uniref:TMV response-related protein n=1 Tax=Zea mays TaxID=4577 RepID=B6UGH4_MAIZE|nr:TMV response-related protein [Zea mays]